MKGYRKTATASFLCFVAAALSVNAILLTWADLQGLGLYIVAGVFWGSILLGLLLFVLASVQFRKHRLLAYERKLVNRQTLPGVFTFRSGRGRIALYLILAAGLICIGTDLWLHWAPDYVMLPILSATVIAFVLHCFLDGRNHQAYEKLKEGMKNGN